MLFLWKEIMKLLNFSNDAKVACRMLGFTHGNITRDSYFGRTGTDFIYSTFVCDSTEGN